MTDEDWVKSAMTDDSMVVEMLVMLNHATPPRKPTLPLDWSVRQRRSKPLMLKPTTSTVSPTTPLSWSGATSFSGGVGAGGGAIDGFEESSRPPSRHSDTTRSKVKGTSETITTKRSRKKKTLAELKEEEILLLKERKHLKRELATLSTSLENQRVTNESLKRMKLDLQSQPAAGANTVVTEEAIANQTQQNIATCDPVPPILPSNVPDNDLDDSQKVRPSNNCSEMQKEVKDREPRFVLPDLNLPLEQDSSSQVLYIMS